MARITPDRVDWADYDRIAPGKYRAYCRWAKRYKDPGFRRWTCLLLFDVFDENMKFLARIPMWLSLGSGEKAFASRRGRFFEEWASANGSAPRRHDRLSLQVFLHRMCRVEIADTTKGPAPYSVVRKIIAWETGCPWVTQSPSHTVNMDLGNSLAGKEM